MKNLLFFILSVALLMTTGCNKAKVMTMTTEADNVKIFFAGSGTITIDWGDGNSIITNTLLAYDEN